MKAKKLVLFYIPFFRIAAQKNIVKDLDRVERSIEASGFNHNVFGEFISLRAGVFVIVEGNV